MLITEANVLTDPDVLAADFRCAMIHGDRREIAEAVRELAEWLDAGGAMPLAELRVGRNRIEYIRHLRDVFRLCQMA